MARADAIHVRCPGNLGLIGLVLAPAFSHRLVAKYAGQWNGFAGEPWTGRLERFLLRSRWWRGPVTVYGEWPDQPHQIVPFFTSMMTAGQIEHAAAIAGEKRLDVPLRVLYSGMLETRKRVDALLDAVTIATARGVRLELAIVGDGPERQSLARRAADSGVGHLVRFAGALPFERALEWYEWAHCLVLPSCHSEGWPKVVAEAMAYGVMCVAVAHGHLPAMLTGRGMLVDHGSPVEIADALGAVAQDPDAFRSITEAGSRWACQYSLEGLRDALATLLTEWWQVPVTVARDRAEECA
jgi:glycosyltransferase involved in cell wall biosynthesis